MWRRARAWRGPGHRLQVKERELARTRRGRLPCHAYDARMRAALSAPEIRKSLAFLRHCACEDGRYLVMQSSSKVTELSSS